MITEWKRTVYACAVFTACFLALSLAGTVKPCLASDVIIDWNRVASDVLVGDSAAQNPGMASRSLAMTNIAMYDAINGILPNYQPFYTHGAVPQATAFSDANDSAQAAAVQAGYRVLASLYPAQQLMLDQNRSAILSGIPDSAAKAAGISYGDSIGQHVFAERSSDGFDNMVTYVASDRPGAWGPDPMNPDQVVWGPEWGQLETFTISVDDMMAPNVPDLTSDQYTAAFNEVKELGAINSTSRTAEETEIGLFWAYDRLGMGTPHKMLNQVLRNIASDSGNSVSENARLFAIASTAVADTGIVAWDAKFNYDFWRPITGIREADTDGNPDTVADPNWIPLGAPGGTFDGEVIPDFTPPFPTYISGHASFGGAFFESLKIFFETDAMEFDVTSEEMPGSMRSYSSFSEAMAEVGRSRVYLGIHWDFDDLVGREVGADVAQYVAANFFQPVPEPSAGAMLAIVMLSLAAFRNSERGRKN